MGNSEYRTVGSLGQKYLEMGLALPCAISRWISLQHPQLLAKDSLHIVLAGAEWGSEVADDGRWYQFIPLLLGRPSMRVKISIVGPGCKTSKFSNPDDPANIFNRPLVIDCTGTLVKKMAAAKFYETTLGGYLRSPEDAIDLVMLAHPNLTVEPEGWFNPLELDAALDAEIPIGITSYGLEIFDHEVWACNAYGYAIAGDAFENPFSVPLDDGAGMALALWEITGKFDNPDSMEQKMEVAEYRKWSTDVYKQMAPEHVEFTGRQIIFNEGQASGIFVPPNFIVDLADGGVWASNHDLTCATALDISLSQDILGNYQEDPLMPHESLVWAMKASCDIKRQIDDGTFRMSEETAGMRIAA